MWLENMQDCFEKIKEVYPEWTGSVSLRVPDTDEIDMIDEGGENNGQQ